MADAKPPITLVELSEKLIPELKSVGAGKRAENFAKFGITNLLELLTHYPRRWVDRTREAPIAEAAEGVDVLVIGELKTVSQPPPGARRGPSRVTASVIDASGRLDLVFFNQPYRARQLKPGSLVAVFGRIGRFNGKKQMVNPTVDVLGDPDERPRPIVAVYPQSEKVDLPSWVVLKAVDETLARCRQRGISDPIDA
ncbi:MAG: OB-fold nucleic acid binding domain-containing protein, partial [Actinomycetota bacterium]